MATQLHHHDLVTASVSGYGANQQQSKTQPTRKAPCTTIALIVAFEVAVVDSAHAEVQV